LVISEIALAFVLLVGSGLLLRSFLELLDVDPGFDPTNVLTAGMPIDPEEHPDPVELNAYVDSIRAAISAVPGVRQTAIASTLPLQGWGFGVPYAIAGRELPERANRRRAFFKIVSASYFDTLGIRLVAGRTLSENDRAGGPRVAVINETLARREFPDKDPIGQQILVPEIMAGRTELGAQIAWQIVGVIAGEKVNGLGDATSAGIYVSNEQSPTYNINLIVRTGTAPAALRRAVRSGIDSVNEGQALSDVRTLRQIVDESMLGNRVASSILTAFAAIALLLAAVGIYGVISYTAAQRTHEMGIRAALGAGSRRLGAMILREGLRVTLLGLAIGLFVTLTLTNIMASMLYGVGPQDPLTLAVVTVLLSSVSGVACALPARKMTKVDPMEALRHH
jgi:putative ABC transport system permease protein